MIKEAAEFAAKAHEGAVRKGSQIPYITHPLETAVIVSLMTEDEEVGEHKYTLFLAFLHEKQYQIPRPAVRQA